MPQTENTLSLIAVGSTVKAKINGDLFDVVYDGWWSAYNMPRVIHTYPDPRNPALTKTSKIARKLWNADGTPLDTTLLEGAPDASVSTTPSPESIVQGAAGVGLVAAAPAAALAVAPHDVELYFTVDERFEFIERMVLLIARGKATSLIITGSGGLGKTHTVFSTLAENDLVEDEDYIVVRGFSTARAVFNALKENKDKIIVFDDCDSVLDDKVSVNLLKGALDTTKKRTVSWLTADDSDRAFDFEGHIIFVSNKELCDIPQPLLSRALFVDVTMTPDEKIQRLRTIIRNVRPDIDMEYKTEILDLMESLKTRIQDLNIRTFIKAVDLRTGETNDPNWKKMATYVMLTQTAKKRR